MEAAGVQDHDRPRRGRPEDLLRLELDGGLLDQRRAVADLADADRHHHRRAARAARAGLLHRDRPRPLLAAGPGPGRHRRRRLRAGQAGLDPDQPARRARRRRPGSTTPTGRRSPPPAPAAPPRWTPSATSPSSPTSPSCRELEATVRRDASRTPQREEHRGQRHRRHRRTFDSKVIRASKPVLVDYWADGGAPARSRRSSKSSPASSATGWFLLDTNTNPRIPATEQGVLGLPTIQIFSAASWVKSFTGRATAPRRSALDEFI